MQIVNVSADKRFFRISTKIGGDEVIAEKVLFPLTDPSQFPLTAEHEKLSEQVPSRVWSTHKTDVGLVKSAQPLSIKVKPGAQLPYLKPRNETSMYAGYGKWNIYNSQNSLISHAMVS